jgi:hypothetical protein
METITRQQALAPAAVFRGQHHGVGYEDADHATKIATVRRPLDITSSYGAGPTKENGRPLFGLGALTLRYVQNRRSSTSTDADGSTPRPSPCGGAGWILSAILNKKITNTTLVTIITLLLLFIKTIKIQSLNNRRFECRLIDQARNIRKLLNRQCNH